MLFVGKKMALAPAHAFLSTMETRTTCVNPNVPQTQNATDLSLVSIKNVLIHALESVGITQNVMLLIIHLAAFACQVTLETHKRVVESLPNVITR